MGANRAKPKNMQFGLRREFQSPQPLLNWNRSQLLKSELAPLGFDTCEVEITADSEYVLHGITK
jgi:hypothetical protein